MWQNLVASTVTAIVSWDHLVLWHRQLQEGNMWHVITLTCGMLWHWPVACHDINMWHIVTSTCGMSWHQHVACDINMWHVTAATHGMLCSDEVKRMHEIFSRPNKRECWNKTKKMIYSIMQRLYGFHQFYYISPRFLSELYRFEAIQLRIIAAHRFIRSITNYVQTNNTLEKLQQTILKQTAAVKQLVFKFSDRYIEHVTFEPHSLYEFTRYSFSWVSEN
jgi:hypothetical protein